MNKLLSPLRSPLTIIGLIAFVDALGFAISMPLFALYAFHQFGATPSQITGVQAFNNSNNSPERLFLSIL